MGENAQPTLNTHTHTHQPQAVDQHPHDDRTSAGKWGGCDKEGSEGDPPRPAFDAGVETKRRRTVREGKRFFTVVAFGFQYDGRRRRTTTMTTTKNTYLHLHLQEKVRRPSLNKVFIKINSPFQEGEVHRIRRKIDDRQRNRIDAM